MSRSKVDVQTFIKDMKTLAQTPDRSDCASPLPQFAPSQNPRCEKKETNVSVALVTKRLKTNFFTNKSSRNTMRISPQRPDPPKSLYSQPFCMPEQNGDVCARSGSMTALRPACAQHQIQQATKYLFNSQQPPAQKDVNVTHILTKKTYAKSMQIIQHLLAVKKLPPITLVFRTPLLQAHQMTLQVEGVASVKRFGKLSREAVLTCLAAMIELLKSYTSQNGMHNNDVEWC